MASGSADQRVQQCQSETLQCPICMKPIEDPRLCAQCSKLFCYSCIHQWLQKANDESGNPACPYCRCMCTIDSFVKILEGSPLYPCKPVADGINATDQLGTDADARKDPDAILHRLEKLLLETQGFFNETNKRVTQELKKQKTLLEQTKNNHIKTVNLMSQQELREIHQQFHAKKSEIEAWSEILTNKLDKHQFDIASVEATLQQSSPKELVVKQTEIENACGKVTEGLKSVTLNIKPHSFKSNLIPEPTSWKFTVHKYSSIRRTNEIQYSDLVSDDIGSVWRLEVHPCGYEDAKNTSLSIFLQLYNGIEGHYHYSVELLGPARNHIYEAEEYFELRKGWGQNHFIDLKSLQESFLVDDGFEIKFAVRALNLVDKYGKLEKRADLLTTEVEHLKKIAYPDCLDEVVTIRNVIDAAKSAACLHSDILCDDIGGQWRLQIYPGGNGECRGQFISIFLEFCSGIPNKYEFTVALLHQNVKKIVKKTLEYTIQPSLPFGWKTFLGREELINNGYIQKDSLSIRLTIKPPNATQKLHYLRQHLEQTREPAGGNKHPARKESVVSYDSKPTTSQEPFESRIRKASISLYKNLFPKSSSTEQP
uniref:RING-type domain-containing protein n=1 Tax=Anopheles minimus TaxID=112268 RepID=A0A182W1E2_9DIPT